MQKTQQTRIIGLASLIFLLFAFYLYQLSKSQQNWMRNDPESYEPNGCKAVNLLLAKNHYLLNRIFQFAPRLSQPLIVYTASDTRIASYEAIMNWVKSGGLLLELPQGTPQFTVEKPLTASKRDYPSQNQLFQGLKYHLKGDLVTDVSQSEEGYLAINGAYLITRQTLGEGQILIWGDPLGITNRSLKAFPDNGVIFSRLIQNSFPPGRIAYLDLRYVRQNSTDSGQFWAELFNTHAVALLLAAIALILAVWRITARFGRVKPLVLIQGRSYDEFVAFLAQLFQRARAESFVLENLWKAFKLAAIAITGLPNDTPSSVILERLHILTGSDYRSLLEIEPLLEAQPLKLSSKQFLNLAASLDAYRKELLEWKNSKDKSLN